MFEASRVIDYFKIIPEYDTVAEREYFQIYLRADSAKNTYKRKNYDVVDFLGDVGGLLESILWMGQTFTVIFAAKLFQGALVSEAYKV